MNNRLTTPVSPPAMHIKLEALRTELADLAYALERQGRVDAADVVMQIDTRVREMAEEITTAPTNSLCSL